MAERRQQESRDQRQIRLRVQQLREYNRFVFWCNLADDYSLNPHVLIGLKTEVYLEMCPYCKAPKFNGETIETCCDAGKIKHKNLFIRIGTHIT